MSLIDKIVNLYTFLAIIMLISFFGGLIYSINNDNVFVDRMTCNKTSITTDRLVFIDGQIKNATQENNEVCESMEELVDKSNTLIYVVILFWALLLKDDFKELIDWISSKIEDE